MHFDEDGQLITGTFVDYALPTAAELPSFETDRTETPSPVNSLGAKGVGEAGTIAASAAVTNAVIDALRPLGVELHQHAPQPDADLGGDRKQPGREPGGRPAVMIPAEFDYTAPESLQDAIGALAAGGEDAKLLAGGHSLIPLMKLRLAAPTLLVDLRKVPGLHGVERQDGHWRVGALTTHSALEHAPELGLVSAVAATIADPQVRHRGTIGGSLAHGDSASDLPAAMLVTERRGHPPGSGRPADAPGGRAVRGLSDDRGRRRMRC